MMSVKLWAFTLLCCCFAAAFIESLAPSGQKKQLSYILGLFVLLCAVSPAVRAVKSDIRLDIKAQSPDITAIDSDEIVKKQFLQRLEKIISQELETLGIFDSDIGIEITISNDSVEISEVIITLSQPDYPKADSVQEKLEQNLKITPEVKIAGR